MFHLVVSFNQSIMINVLIIHQGDIVHKERQMYGQKIKTTNNNHMKKHRILKVSNMDLIILMTTNMNLKLIMLICYYVKKV